MNDVEDVFPFLLEDEVETIGGCGDGLSILLNPT